METTFNESGTSNLITEGVDLTLAGLGLDDVLLQRPSQVQDTLEALSAARDTVRNYASSLANDLYVINTRLDFTSRTITVLEEGSNELIAADLNEESASQLAAQTRLTISQTALGLASQTQASILSLFINR